MTEVTAYAASAPTSSFEKVTVRRRELGPHDVSIDVAYVGICHSDIHIARNEWGRTRYPCVPGHEITGVVSAIGTAVTRFRIGDRVGVGCLVDSCGDCAACTAGEEQYCVRGATLTYNSAVPQAVQPGGHTLGGYATRVVVTENFVVEVPDQLGLDVAAPLLCAGITVYSPLRQWNAGPGRRVGIVGMGGLGHIGVMIAVAMGAEVTVLSRTLSKRADGERFGAHHYCATSDTDALRALDGHFDLILTTVSDEVPVDRFLRLLALDGTLVVLGLPGRPMSVDGFALAGNRRVLAGSMMGGIAATQDMLNFCAEHGIGAEIEVVGAGDIDAAYARVVAGDVRYRFVIDAATM